MAKSIPFSELPLEIADHICSFLQQSELSALIATSKSIYQLFRPILYRHPKVVSFTSLSLLSRTCTKATFMGKIDHKWSTQESLNQIKTLDITIDLIQDSTRNRGQPLAAILVSRYIESIVRRCPDLAITLRFTHCECNHSPISGFDSETFPRVINLILFVGRHEPDGSLPWTHTGCKPNAKFWRPLVNGVSFPDCLHLELRHFWATYPPIHASLDLSRNHCSTNDNGHIPHWLRNIRRPPGLVDEPIREDQIVGRTKGLTRFESIMLECPRELDSLLVMQLLGNPDSVAVNLSKLELRYCDLDYGTISKLIYHAPPNLKHFVLLCSDDNRQYYSNTDTVPHLCPLIRDFSKKLVHLEFANTTICRELFFDEAEMESLRKNGITTRLGNDGGAVEGHEKLDTYAIREVVQACRRQKRSKHCVSRIQEAIKTAKAQSGRMTTSNLFGGDGSGTGSVTSAARAQREAEALLNEEEVQRTRLIEGSKTPWFRRMITWQGLCQPNDTWEEVQLAADMEEVGIKWVMANIRLKIASQHSHGKLPVSLAIGRAMEEEFDFTLGQFSEEVDPEPDAV